MSKKSKTSFGRTLTQVSSKFEDNDEEVIVIRTTETKLREAQQKILDIGNLNDVPDSLGHLSATACAFQFIQAAFLFIMASRRDFRWNLYTSFPNANSFSEPEPKHVASFSVLYFSPFFIALSGLEHLSCLVFRKTYVWYIARHQNPFRWTEYTFSASLMRVMVAQLVGITDVHLLFCIFVLTALMIQTGAAHESVNAKARADSLKQNWHPYRLALIAHSSVWFIIFNYFGVSVQRGYEEGFIWAIVVIIFILDCSFALLFTMQWLKIGPFQGTLMCPSTFLNFIHSVSSGQRCVLSLCLFNTPRLCIG